LKIVASVETQQKENAETTKLLEAETTKLGEMKGSIESKLAGLRDEIEQVRPARSSAAEEVSKKSAKALQVYERLAERYDGEAMAPIAQPDPRSEQYVCTACNMELVIDIYNRLKTRDDLVMCPNCGRMLYIPDDMPAVTIPAKTKSATTRAPSTRKTAARGEAPSAPADPVKAELNRLLTKAAGESARNAIAAGNTPAEFEVYIEGKYIGNYKGQNIDNFRRTARYCLQEAGVIKDMEVYEKGQGPKSQQAAAAAAVAAAQSASAVAAATEGATPDGAAAMPEEAKAETGDMPTPAPVGAAPVAGHDVADRPPAPEVPQPDSAASPPVEETADPGEPAPASERA
jgi:hypothetical protein